MEVPRSPAKDFIQRNSERLSPVYARSDVGRGVVVRGYLIHSQHRQPGIRHRLRI